MLCDDYARSPTEPLSLILPPPVRGYTFEKVIGKGGYSQVFLVRDKKFNKQYCAKVMNMDPSEDTASLMKAVETEINILVGLNHPHIIRLYDQFFVKGKFYLILEYCTKGSLHDHVKSRGMDEYHFIETAKQIVEALAFCHKNNVAHRDIKPGNVLLDELNRVKLADFGISIRLQHNVKHSSYSGSLLYEAPEVINKLPHDPFKADIWSLGVLFAFMINGITPWHCDNKGLLKSRITSGKYVLLSNTPKEIADLISKMLVVDPDQRITIEELQQYPIFKQSSIKISYSFNSGTVDALSVNGRRIGSHNSFMKTRQEQLHSKALVIYNLNMKIGRSRLPKIQARYHTDKGDNE